jgi:hypothetical protein
MVHAAENGVAGLSRVDSTPRRGKVLKSFLGDKVQLLQLLGELDNQYHGVLPARVERIFVGMEKRKK